MSKNLRGMCEDSLMNVSSLFSKMNNPLCFAHSVFTVSLKMRKTGRKDPTIDFTDPVEIFLHPELSEFKSAISGSLKSIVNASRDFNRAETIIGSLFGGKNSSHVNTTKTKKLNDASVSMTDTILVTTTQEIHRNLSNYFDGPSGLLKNFKDIEKLLNGDVSRKVNKVIRECAGSQNTSETLELFTNVCMELGFEIN